MTINYDVRLRKVVSTQKIITKGVSFNIPIDELSEKVNAVATKIVANNLVKKQFNVQSVSEGIQEEVSKLVNRLTQHRPIVIPVLVEISK